MDLVLGTAEVVTLGLCAHIFKKWHRKQNGLQDLIAYVQRASVLSPSQLQKIMEPSTSDGLLQSLKEYDEGSTYSRGFALVQGLVSSDYIVRSLLNHSTRLVISAVSSEQMLSHNHSFEEDEKKIRVRSVSEFRLNDASDKTKSITLSNSTSNINYSDAMHLIHSVQHTRNLSPVEQFLTWIIFFFRLFLSMSNVGKKMSGFKVGTRRIERGVMVGQFMIAFGEIIYDRFSKTLRMNNPVYFMKEKEQLLQHLRDKNTQLGRNMTLVMSVILFVGMLFIKRLVRVGKRLMEKYNKHVQMKKLDKFYRIDRLTTNNFKCMECGDHPRNVIFKPCLHLAVCWLCESKMDVRRCPICRQSVDEGVIIYVV